MNYTLSVSEYLHNIENGKIKHYNECKHNFLRDNVQEIAEMFASIVKGTPPIEIMDGPCKGMVIKTSRDVHLWIEKHVEEMSLTFPVTR